MKKGLSRHSIISKTFSLLMVFALVISMLPAFSTAVADDSNVSPDLAVLAALDSDDSDGSGVSGATGSVMSSEESELSSETGGEPVTGRGGEIAVESEGGSEQEQEQESAAGSVSTSETGELATSGSGDGASDTSGSGSAAQDGSGASSEQASSEESSPSDRLDTGLLESEDETSPDTNAGGESSPGSDSGKASAGSNSGSSSSPETTDDTSAMDKGSSASKGGAGSAVLGSPESDDSELLESDLPESAESESGGLSVIESEGAGSVEEGQKGTDGLAGQEAGSEQIDEHTKRSASISGHLYTVEKAESDGEEEIGGGEIGISPGIGGIGIKPGIGGVLGSIGVGLGGIGGKGTLKPVTEEPNPLTDFVVSLYYSFDLTNPIATTSTDLDGAYTFDKLAAGDYVIGFEIEQLINFGELPEILGDKFTVDEESVPLTAYSEIITLGAGQIVDDIDATIEIAPVNGPMRGPMMIMGNGNSSISGVVWNDGDGTKPATDWNGVKDITEFFIQNVPVYLYDDVGTLIDDTLTDINGEYMFTGLDPGNYVVMIENVTLVGKTFIMPPAKKADNKFAADPNDKTKAYTDIIPLGPAQNITDIKAGLRERPNLKKIAPEIIDLATIDNTSTGTGWKFTQLNGGANYGEGTITFDSNASGREYTLIRGYNPGTSNIGNSIKRHIEIISANNVTIKYDGSQMLMAQVSGYYYPFDSNITVKGGSDNTIIIDNLPFLNISTVTIDNAASNTKLIYNNVNLINSNRGGTAPNYFFTSDIIIKNDGAYSRFDFNNVYLHKTTIYHNAINASGTASIFYSGTNSFVSAQAQLITVIAASANLKMYLDGSTTVNNGYIRVPKTATLTIDSVTSGSQQGSFSITYNVTGTSNVGAIIGSDGGQLSSIGNGLITINGGTITAKHAGSQPGSAAIGGGTGQPGDVIINGGKVIANSYDGAAIGGGYGTNGHGSVTINGGDITATTTGGGAAIGGGRGAKGLVTISNAIINAKSAVGAGIGGGQCTGISQTNGHGEVTIHSGNYTISTGSGAGIGGGGATGSSLFDVGEGKVIIYNGIFNIVTLNGAGVGHGGTSQNLTTSPAPSGMTGYVEIHDGRFIIETGTGVFDAGMGIGGAQNSQKYPKITISKKADIVVFGKVYSNYAGIFTGTRFTTTYNLGDAFFINGIFGEKPAGGSFSYTPINDARLIVYRTDDLNNGIKVPIRAIKIPAKIYWFGFTTGSNISEDHTLYIGSYATGVKQIIRSVDLKPQIYSVNRSIQYDEDGKGGVQYWQSLLMKFGSEAYLTQYWLVEENYIDINGGAELLPNKWWTQIENQKYYTNAEAKIEAIDDYELIGYTWGSPPSGGVYTPIGTLINKQMLQSEKIYFVYQKKPDTTNITIGKTVSGLFGSKIHEFDFEIYFKDNAGAPMGATSFNVTGGTDSSTTATAPTITTLTVQSGGKAVFKLSHGQTITIHNVPADAEVKIWETTDNNYTSTYTDSGGASGVNDDNVKMDFRKLSKTHRTFVFNNDCIVVAPTGLANDVQVAEILLVIMLLMLVALVVIEIRRSQIWSKQK